MDLERGAKPFSFFPRACIIREHMVAFFFVRRYTAMKRFEYKCVWIVGGGEKTSRVLNEYGREGWELVCVVGMWHYLKREL